VHCDSFEFNNLGTSTQKISFFDNSFERFFKRFAVVTAAVICGYGPLTRTTIARTRGPQFHMFFLYRTLGTPAKLFFLQTTLDLRDINEQRALVYVASPFFRNRFCRL
jgi:hypothetical protein